MPNISRIFHAGDPFWAKLGKPIGETENNPYPDRWKSRDLSNGAKISIGIGVIVAGTAIGGPIGSGIVVGCFAVGATIGIANSHFRQRRLDNLQSYVGEINARARIIAQEFQIDTHNHNNHKSCNHHNHHKDNHHTKHKNDHNCSDKITHGIIHPLEHKKGKFVAINFIRYFTNIVSGARASSTIANIAIESSMEISTIANSSAGIGVVNDATIAGIDGARAGYYAYHIYNEEYKRYADIITKRDQKLGESNQYYSSEQAFKLLKKLNYGNKLTILGEILEESENIDDFLVNTIKQQKKWGRETLPVTELAFFMDNFALITESKQLSISEDKIRKFLEKSFDHFQIKERWGPRSRILPYRNDVLYHIDDNGKKEEISLKSWQVKQRLRFDEVKIESLKSNDLNIQDLSDKINSIIDPNLKNTKLGKIQHQNIYNILMIEALESQNLDVVIQIINNLSESLNGKKLSPVLIREELSKNSYGHPHQELDGYAQKPAKLLGVLASNITYSETYQSLKTLTTKFLAIPAISEEYKEIERLKRDQEINEANDKVYSERKKDDYRIPPLFQEENYTKKNTGSNSVTIESSEVTLSYNSCCPKPIIKKITVDKVLNSTPNLNKSHNF